MIHRKIVMTLLLMLSLAGAWAQSNVPRLVVWQKSGEKAYFDLDKLPETSFGGGVLTIKSSTATISYQLSNIVRYTYENVTATGIATLPSAYSVKISERGEAVSFQNLKPGTTVSLYDLGGMLLEQYTADDLGLLTISTHNRPSGVYIVKANNETIKLLKP